MNSWCASFLTAIIALVACAHGCDDTHGMHCLSGKWECPGDIFDKEGRGIKETFCSNKCCLCVRSAGTSRCTPDDLKPNQEIFINPNFPDYPTKGTCQWCPKGTEKATYSHKCFDQRTVGFENQLNTCRDFPLVKERVDPNGIGNVAPVKVDIASAFNNFKPVKLG